MNNNKINSEDFIIIGIKSIKKLLDNVTSTSYCICKLGSTLNNWKEKKDNTIRKSYLCLEDNDSIFNFVFSYNIYELFNKSYNDLSQADLELHVQFYDGGLIFNKLIGECRIPIQNLIKTNDLVEYKLYPSGKIMITTDKNMHNNNISWFNAKYRNIINKINNIVYYKNIAQSGIAQFGTKYNLRQYFIDKTDDKINQTWNGPENTNSITYNKYSDVKKRLEEFPEKYGTNNLNSEQIHLNYLGIMKLNNAMWPELQEIDRGIGLSQSQEDHNFSREYMDKILGPNNNYWSTDDIKENAQLFFTNRNKFNMTDVKKWSLKLLHKIFLKIILTDTEVTEFMDLQSIILIYMTIPQKIVDNRFIKYAINLNDINNKKLKWIELYKKQIRIQFPEIKDENKIILLASSIMDALLFAGGISVSTVISYCIVLLYSKWLYDKLGENFMLSDDNLYCYIMEIIRFFPPVGFFVYRENTINSDMTVYLNLYMASCDKEIWGNDAHNFKLRTKKEYMQLMVNWADYANNDNDKYKNNSRKCPAKDLSIVMITSFIKEFMATSYDKNNIFNPNNWLSDTKSNKINITDTVVSNITLEKLRTKLSSNIFSIEKIKTDFNSYYSIYDYIYYVLPIAYKENITTNYFKEKKQFKFQTLSTGDFGELNIMLEYDTKPSYQINIISILSSLLNYLPKSDSLYYFDSDDQAILFMMKYYNKKLPDQYTIINDFESDEFISNLFFYGAGQMHLEYISEINNDIPNAKYKVDLLYLSKYNVRPTFSKYGNIAYFDINKKLINIWSGHYDKLFNKNDKEWNNVKLVLKSSFFIDITVKYHLVYIHLIFSNNLMIATKENLSLNHHLRSLFDIFIYNTATVNINAMYNLVSNTSYMSYFFAFDKSSFDQIMTDYLNNWIHFDTNPFKNNNLSLNDLPFYTDGKELYDIIKNLFTNYINEYYNDNNKVENDIELINFWNNLKNNNIKTKLNELNKVSLIDYLTNTIWWITAGHEIYGSIVQYLVHPKGLPNKVVINSESVDIQSFIKNLNLISLTSTRHPSLLINYNDFFDNKKIKIINQFQSKLKDLSIKIDDLNKDRAIKFNSFNPKYLECSVGV